MSPATPGHARFLGDLLCHASSTVPRFRGLGGDISSYPVTEKPEMVSDPASFISEAELAPADRRHLAKALTKPEDFNNRWNGADTPWRGDILVEGTTGTTGLPFRFPRTRGERARIATGIWKQRKAIDPAATPAGFYPFFHVSAHHAHTVDPFDCSPQNVNRLYSHLNEKRIRWVHSYPGLIANHARSVAAEVAQSHSLRFVELSGVFPSPEVETAIPLRLRAQLVNQFGCTEVLAIGYGMNADTFDVLAENIYVEIVDSTGQPVTTEGTVGRLLVTARHQRLFPFIRYATGDQAYWQIAGRRFVVVNRNRDSEDAKWGSYRSGAHYFRIAVTKAFEISGLIDFQFLQIREEAGSRFSVLTEAHPRAGAFFEALRCVCEYDPVSQHIVLVHNILNDCSLAVELRSKPRLFVPCPVWFNPLLAAANKAAASGQNGHASHGDGDGPSGPPNHL